MKAKTCVVVSYWNGRPPRLLRRLLRQMLRVDAGTSFKLVIVCNGGNEKPLHLPSEFDRLHPLVLNRENTGYNIGAWDFGWRVVNDCEYFLFLQDECFLKKPGWVSEFEFRMENDSGIGLLGESITWDRMSWPYIRTATDRDLGVEWFKGEPAHPLDVYRDHLGKIEIPPGDVGTHLQSLMLFTSRKILVEIGGFPKGSNYREAVACEIGVSRLIEARGYRISKVKDHPFALIGHSQWTAIDRLKRRVRKAVVAPIKSVLRFLRLP
jgi:hypothetical protein